MEMKLDNRLKDKDIDYLIVYRQELLVTSEERQKFTCSHDSPSSKLFHLCLFGHMSKHLSILIFVGIRGMTSPAL